MQTTIENLFNGNIYPLEQLRPRMPEYKSLAKSSCDLEAKFIESLSQKQCDDFMVVMNSQVSVSTFAQTQSFVDGFRLGIKIMTETFSEGV